MITTIPRRMRMRSLIYPDYVEIFRQDPQIETGTIRIPFAFQLADVLEILPSTDNEDFEQRQWRQTCRRRKRERGKVLRERSLETLSRRSAASLYDDAVTHFPVAFSEESRDKEIRAATNSAAQRSNRRSNRANALRQIREVRKDERDGKSIGLPLRLYPLATASTTADPWSAAELRVISRARRFRHLSPPLSLSLSRIYEFCELRECQNFIQRERTHLLSWSFLSLRGPQTVDN